MMKQWSIPTFISGLELMQIWNQQRKKDSMSTSDKNERGRGSSSKSFLTKQVGGSHYKKYRIQPVEYAMANGLNYCQANAIKYTTRYKDKGGVEDLRKAIHNLELLIELEENDRAEQVLRESQERDAEEESYRKGLTTPEVPTEGG